MVVKVTGLGRRRCACQEMHSRISAKKCDAQLLAMAERLVLVCSTVRRVQGNPSAPDLPGGRKRFQGKTEGGGLLSFPLVAPLNAVGRHGRNARGGAEHAVDGEAKSQRVQPRLAI